MKKIKISYVGIVLGALSSLLIWYLLQDRVIGSSFRKSDLRKMEANGMRPGDVLDIERVADSISKNPNVSETEFNILKNSTESEVPLTRAFALSTMARIKNEPYKSFTKNIIMERYNKSSDPSEKASILLSMREADIPEWKELAKKDSTSPDAHLSKIARRLLDNPGLPPK